ncbi:MAG: LacI family DNA-binding transcriptional regulator [Planctomycetota bacterium]
MTLGIAREKTDKHETLRRTLQQDIAEGRFRPGDLFYSQNEIAERFGVSQTTVLRALRALVEDGYIRREPGRGTFVNRPRETPRKLRSILVVGYDPQVFQKTDIAAEPMEMLFARAAQEGIRMQYVHTPAAANGELALPDLCDFDGIIFNYGGWGLPWRIVHETDAAIVIIRPADFTTVGRFDIVNRDYIGGPRAVLEHFRERGYRSVGILGGAEHSPTHHIRMEGSLRGAIEFGFTIKPEWIVLGEWNPEKTYRGSLELLRKEDRPRAVFAFGDGTAAQVIRAAHDLELRVPQDVAVAGFDDLDIARHLSPALTCYRTDAAELARTVYELLETRLADPDLPARYVVIPGAVVVRQST